ncbi:Mgm101p SCDLUD_004392 [Saccharomycodes ludwigii]|uniref:Mgm101p n=1 Tax=Saccharomycodes ludwigii TaxID=36035 RepID=UPI001E820A2A|nr:hypothetical protein SCDLUD_004392 [Saccharomycodes ludwigii]KAH3900073.1 hypothetical protein SCDLUD_004392 [Saccharomycodes ludwigii]
MFSSRLFFPSRPTKLPLNTLRIKRSYAVSRVIKTGSNSNNTNNNSAKNNAPTSTSTIDNNKTAPFTSATNVTTSKSTVSAFPNGKTLYSALNSKSLNDFNNDSINTTKEIDWTTSFLGLGSKPFNDKVQEALAEALTISDIEIKPDGLIYLPEIKYRRILNRAFGAGGWGLVPRSETVITPKLVTREYGLICHGQLVSVARGEQDYFNVEGIPTATEGCKSNALMRCCKDLGIGSELWDPVFIKNFKKKNCVDKFVEHITTGRKKKIWLRKDREVEYPFK